MTIQMMSMARTDQKESSTSHQSLRKFILKNEPLNSLL